MQNLKVGTAIYNGLSDDLAEDVAYAHARKLRDTADAALASPAADDESASTQELVSLIETTCQQALINDAVKTGIWEKFVTTSVHLDLLHPLASGATLALHGNLHTESKDKRNFSLQIWSHGVRIGSALVALRRAAEPGRAGD